MHHFNINIWIYNNKIINNKCSINNKNQIIKIFKMDTNKINKIDNQIIEMHLDNIIMKEINKLTLNYIRIKINIKII